MGGGGQGGGGFFSIPPEKVIAVSFNSVCLEHGKPEPGPSSKYTIVPISRLSKDPVLHQLLAAVGTGKVDPQAAQAATWHLTDKMSFEELAAKTEEHLGEIASTPYFTRSQLLMAQQLLAQAEARAEELELAGKTEKKTESKPVSIRTAQPATN